MSVVWWPRYKSGTPATSFCSGRIFTPAAADVAARDQERESGGGDEWQQFGAVQCVFFAAPQPFELNESISAVLVAIANCALLFRVCVSACV